MLDAHLQDGVSLRYVREMVYFGDPAALLPLDSDRDGRLGRDEAATAGTLSSDRPGWDEWERTTTAGRSNQWVTNLRLVGAGGRRTRAWPSTTTTP